MKKRHDNTMKALGVDKKKTQKKTKDAHYRFLEAIYMSFFSGRLYVDVVRRWRGFGFTYLLLMFSIFILPYAVRITQEYQHLSGEALTEPLKKLPPFYVRNGAVRFHDAMPYFVRNDQNDVISIIDTTGEINHLPQGLYPKASILVTKHALHLYPPAMNVFGQKKLSEKKENILAFDANENVRFVGEDILKKNHINRVDNLLAILIYPTMLIFYFVMYVVILLAMTLFAQFVARFMFKVMLTFKEASRLLIVASTPQAFVYFLLFALNKVYPGTGVLYFVLLSGYFSLGVLAYRRDNRAMVLQ